MSDVVVITGSAGALGSELAHQLVALGYRAGLLDLPQSAERLHALARSLGEAAYAVEIDIAQASAWSKALTALEQQLGPPTHAVLVAGGWQGGTALHEQDDDQQWRSMLDSNLETAHAALRALLPGMVKRRRGSIVLIGSQVVERPWTATGASAYAVAKAGVVALARVVAQEVLEYGVRVNVVLPSTLDTPANRRAMPKADPSRWVSTESASTVIAFLLSEQARDVSSAVLPIYGRS